MLTWSLACTLSPARRAITSLAFMFVEVPEPVWKTSIGNWRSCLPAAISAASARAGLEDVDRELAVVLAGGDLSGRLLDAPGAAFGEQPEFAVDGCGRAL